MRSRSLASSLTRALAARRVPQQREIAAGSGRLKLLAPETRRRPGCAAGGSPAARSFPPTGSAGRSSDVHVLRAARLALDQSPREMMWTGSSRPLSSSARRARATRVGELLHEHSRAHASGDESEGQWPGGRQASSATQRVATDRPARGPLEAPSKECTLLSRGAGNAASVCNSARAADPERPPEPTVRGRAARISTKAVDDLADHGRVALAAGTLEERERRSSRGRAHQARRAAGQR